MGKKTIKILIVEDEKPLAKALGLKLKHVGFETKEVFNGKQALEVLEKEQFCLIILDLMMPEMDGFGVLKVLQDRNNKTPIIVASNLGQQHDIKEAKSLGAKDYFVKSDTPLTDVVEKVKDIVGK
ncbi:response regulator transcription factor [Patescibacteria group bacterium]